MKMAAEKITIGEVKCRRPDDPGYQSHTIGKIVLVVRRLGSAVGNDKRCLAASS
jgi:hypothetical protein